MADFIEWKEAFPDCNVAPCPPVILAGDQVIDGARRVMAAKRAGFALVRVREVAV